MSGDPIRMIQRDMAQRLKRHAKVLRAKQELRKVLPKVAISTMKAQRQIQQSQTDLEIEREIERSMDEFERQNPGYFKKER